MIHDLDETLREKIYELGNLSKEDVDVSFEQPDAQWAASLTRPTINCWLHDMRENMELRNRNWAVERQDGQARKEMMPLRFDLHYLVTAWVSRAEDEHKLLWRTLAALSQLVKLDPAECHGDLQNQPYDLPVRVGQQPVVNLTDLWSVLDSGMRVGFALTTTLALDTGLAVEAPLVFEGQVRVGQSADPRRRELTEPDTELIIRADDE